MLVAMSEVHDGSLSAFAALMGGSGRQTIEHCLRIRESCVRLGALMGLAERELHDLENAALLHDVGMFRVPYDVRQKEGALAEDEWAALRQHADLGADMVREIATLEGAADIIRSHHERLDGSGYPRGLAGEAIPLAARILAVVDTYDAIRMRHAEDPDGGHGHAMAELKAHAGTLFDDAVVAAFAKDAG
jgi:putative nucleotidyltransferase with HDIG domain